MRSLRRLLLAVALAAVWAPAALAAAPANDRPAAAAAFEPYAAVNGTPAELQAVAEPAEATFDRGVPRCLGRRSFARTVWYRIPAAATPRELTVEASGRTLDPLDLAAFVQPRADGAPATSRPNACAGHGVGGSDAAEDRSPALALNVPAWRSVLVQVGRRGAPRSPDDERVVLSLDQRDLPLTRTLPGDRAGSRTPKLRRSGRAIVSLAGATTSEEDPATPACPTLGGVWRRVAARRSGRFTVTVAGWHASALSVFTGRRPRPAGAVDCVDREGAGPLVLPFGARAKRRLWIRIGTDRAPAGARARLVLRPAARGERRSGGACLTALRPRLAGALAGGPARARTRNRASRIAVVVRVLRGPVCSARLTLTGPRGRLYGSGFAHALRGRAHVISLRRTRRLVSGRYRVQVEATRAGGVRGAVPSSFSFRLR